MTDGLICNLRYYRGSVLPKCLLFFNQCGREAFFTARAVFLLSQARSPPIVTIEETHHRRLNVTDLFTQSVYTNLNIAHSTRNLPDIQPVVYRKASHHTLIEQNTKQKYQ